MFVFLSVSGSSEVLDDIDGDSEQIGKVMYVPVTSAINRPRNFSEDLLVLWGEL